MKIAIVFLFVILKVNSCERHRSNSTDECYQILTTIFNMDLFYKNKTPGLNFTPIDTIIILDKKGLLKNYTCSNIYKLKIDSSVLKKGMDYSWGDEEVKALLPFLKPANANKVCIIKNNDSIPIQILRFNATNAQADDPKYSCYLSLQELRIAKDTIDMEFVKYVTNHIIQIVLIKNGNTYKAVNQFLGQI